MIAPSHAPTQKIHPTLSLQQATHQQWDVVVIGAGPAGAAAAYQLGKAGRSVLLVDKSSFPRYKVCGCCLNRSALQSLDAMGLSRITRSNGVYPLTALRLFAASKPLDIQLPSGVSMSRTAFDAALIRQAILAGGAFIPEAMASLQPHQPASNNRQVLLQVGTDTAQVSGQIVLVADGLGGRALQGTLIKESVDVNSRIGAGATVTTAPDFYRPGTIFMAQIRGGYVGMVRLEDEQLAIAAALDPSLIRSHHGLGSTVKHILAQAGLPPITSLDSLAWRGTAALTRHRSPLGTHRVFVLGDAAGYVEPFTGEGIAWALGSARAVIPLAHRGIDNWRPSLVTQWTHQHRALIGQRQKACRVIRWVLHRNTLTQAAITGLRISPVLNRWLARSVGKPMDIVNNILQGPSK